MQLMISRQPLNESVENTRVNGRLPPPSRNILLTCSTACTRRAQPRGTDVGPDLRLCFFQCILLKMHIRSAWVSCTSRRLGSVTMLPFLYILMASAILRLTDPSERAS
eukprot:56846-Eustigmatos_ZCMA.PRE.1